MPSLDITAQRLRNERLIGAPFRKPEEVVEWLGAVQAQDYLGAKWGVGQRVKNCMDADVGQAFASGKILRTHMMRPTWHFVTPADIRWIQELTAPRVHTMNGTQYRKLELDRAVLKRSEAMLAKTLQGGKHLTRAELAQVLKRAGIPASGQRLAYIIMHAELNALICNGALRGKQHTYALLDERAPNAKKLPRDEALAELTRRYFTSHGPALVQDFAWWSGLTVADARAGIEMARPRLLHEVIEGKTYWFASVASGAKIKDPTIHLLPNYDEYLIAYKDHGPSFAASLPVKAFARDNVLAAHIVVLNGKVIGGWRRTFEKKEVRIEAKLPIPLNKAEKDALHAMAERYGRFLRMQARLIIER